MFFGISIENLLLERSRLVTDGTNSAMSNGRGPESSLLERSNPVRLVQFLMPRGNWPLNPMSLSLRFKTLFSSGCQHSTPVNLQMKPSVLLLKFHEVLR